MVRSGFMRRRFVPARSFEHAINVFASGNGDKVRGLHYLDAIAIINKAHAGKQSFFFTREHMVFTNDIVYSFGNIFRCWQELSK